MKNEDSIFENRKRKYLMTVEEMPGEDGKQVAAPCDGG